MAFNSWEFLVFLPLVVLVYYTLCHRGQNLLLLLASYFFYGWWDYRFCGLLALSTVVDYLVARSMVRAEGVRRKQLLWISLATNLGILGFFKYCNFFVDSAANVLDAMGMQANLPVLQVILPVGISFYTFQTLSYSIDVYRGRLEPAKNPIDFALYVSFFPQLVAGPIERATHLLPQFQCKRTVSWDQLSSGCQLIFLGFARKLLIADVVAGPVNEIFADPGSQSSTTLIIGLYLFSIQIYCDFAGYSDIARGCARILGINLIRNFEHPYFSRSITEFWRRWHISLSGWLRDYLYIPLGGNRKGALMTYRNLMLTMLLGGLWHGANWTFVVWGAVHGFYLSVHRFLLGDRRVDPELRSRSVAGWVRDIGLMFVTFNLVALTWVLFRTENLEAAWSYLTGIVFFHGGLASFGWPVLAMAGVILLMIDVPQYLSKRHTVFLRWWWPIRTGVYVGFALLFCLVRSDGEQTFIYFQF